MRKTTYLILSILISTVLLTACSAGNNAQGQQAAAGPTNSSVQATGSQASASNEKVFTKDELSKFDGQNGNPAYIAVNGIVYDVTNVGAWRNGQHKGGYKAGMDLTDAFKTSPHDSSIFNGIPVAGKFAG
jgi:predicted heme/steroid binding protein